MVLAIENSKYVCTQNLKNDPYLNNSVAHCNLFLNQATLLSNSIIINIKNVIVSIVN